MNYTVIVAEDEELLLNNLVHKIEKADPDFQVIGTAQTGAQALSLVEQMSPDVIFTDIKMPVMDGITLLTRIRDQFPFTKFVITSGFSDFEYAKKAITLKVSDYLLKPVDPDELRNVLLKIKQELQIKRDDYRNRIRPRCFLHVTGTDCRASQELHGTELCRGYQPEPDCRNHELQSQLPDQDLLSGL